ncbi:MAG: translocation/assembly module TamB domain-containing protein, partial [Cyclobacteriaceae bacterium]
SERGLFFRSLDLISEDKRASLNGLLSETENSTVSFVARKIDLQQFNSVLGLPIKGILEADVSIFKRLNEPVQFEGDFNLYDFVYKNLTVGDIRGNSYYDNELHAINARLSVERENVRTISIGGHYFPERTDQLDFILTFDRADFKLLEFVTEGNLSDVSGSASGELKIMGPTEKPVVTGYCSLTDAKFKVDYLGTVYNMNGRIDFKKEEILLRDIVMRDIRGEKAILGGAIRHQNFDKIVTDLHISAKNFNFLNTTSSENELYYGQANASGDIYVKGPFDDLILKVNAKTERGTKFFIPLSGGSTYEQAEFMTFVNLSDTSRNSSIEESVGSALGLTLDFDLEVTNEAYCELIFDIRTGDIIRGRGNGNLKLRMDKNGNFELFGPLTIEEGGYNFTVPGFINKEFQVVPGSTINWYGDPYTGTMDLSATYRQKASFSDLSSDPADKEDGELTQKYPVIVILELQGQMLSPTIDFDVMLDESAPQNQKVTRLLSQVKQDEQQMKRQVVSLLFFKRFSPLQDGFVGGGGGVSIGKSLSEFLTNQISYLASQLDENLEVEVDLTDLDQEGFNTFQLRLAYTFMDGRLKVTRGGDFTSATSEENNVVSDIIGDWTVEYMLTRDGKLRAKMFSQSNQTRLNADGSQNLETGLSLKYVTSFNNFKDLMGQTRKTAIRRKEEESQVEQDSQ